MRKGQRILYTNLCDDVLRSDATDAESLLCSEAMIACDRRARKMGDGGRGSSMVVQSRSTRGMGISECVILVSCQSHFNTLTGRNESDLYGAWYCGSGANELGLRLPCRGANDIEEGMEVGGGEIGGASAHLSATVLAMAVMMALCEAARSRSASFPSECRTSTRFATALLTCEMKDNRRMQK